MQRHHYSSKISYGSREDTIHLLSGALLVGKIISTLPGFREACAETFTIYQYSISALYLRLALHLYLVSFAKYILTGYQPYRNHWYHPLRQ